MKMNYVLMIGGASVLILALGLAAANAQPAQEHIPADVKVYDSRGNVSATISRDSAGNTRTYDARGNTVGTSSPITGGRNYYDAGGNHVGTSTRGGRR
jgi:hypothetical protein